MRWSSVVRRVLASVAVLAAASCAAGSPERPDPTSAAPTIVAPVQRDPVEFSFATLDGELVTSAALRDRLTLVLLGASFDEPSQTEALIVRELCERWVPRINGLLVVVEPAENRPMVEAFASALAAPFPVVLADATTRAGRGPFGALPGVPVLVLLDREGREIWRHVGLVPPETIQAALRAADVQAGRAPAGAASAAPP